MPELLTMENIKDQPHEWPFWTFATPFAKEIIANHKQGDPYVVDLKICGVEVTFSNFIARLKEDAVRWANERAAQLVEEKGDPLLKEFDAFQGEITTYLREKRYKMFPEVHLPDDRD
jgi:hypothetical protein